MISQKQVSMIQGMNSKKNVLISTFTHISLRGDLNSDLISQGNKMCFWVPEPLSVHLFFFSLLIQRASTFSQQFNFSFFSRVFSLMPSNANAICCQRNPNTFLSQQALFFLFSQIPFFSFCLHLLNFPATIHFGYWPNEYQLTMYTSQER